MFRKKQHVFVDGIKQTVGQKTFEDVIERQL